MIPGYNHNVKYKDRVYHVQTEDSGVANPHVITHLFVGGNIVESRKTSYANLVGKDRLTEELVNIMQGQHKGMLKDLIGGRFDDKILERSVNAATLNGPAPLNVDAGAQHRASFGMGGGGDAPAAKTDKAAVRAPIPAPAPITIPSQTPVVARPAAQAAPPKPTIGGPAPLQAPRPPPLPAAPPTQAPAAPRPPAAQPGRPSAQPIAAQAQTPQASPTFGAPPPKRPSAQPTANAPAAIARPVPPPAPIAQAPAAADGSMVLEAEALARAFESQNESAVECKICLVFLKEKNPHKMKFI
jgi:hypothetical protein